MTTTPAQLRDLQIADAPSAPPCSASSAVDRLAKARLARDPHAPRLDPIQRAALNPRSRALAIAGKCWDCVGGSADPKPRERIRLCEVPRCSLYPLRPYQTADDETDESEAQP